MWFILYLLQNNTASDLMVETHIISIHQKPDIKETYKAFSLQTPASLMLHNLMISQHLKEFYNTKWTCSI